MSEITNYVDAITARSNLAALHELLMEEGISYSYTAGAGEGQHDSAEVVIDGYLFLSSLEQLIAWVKGHSGSTINFGYSNAGAVTVRYRWDGES